MVPPACFCSATHCIFFFSFCISCWRSRRSARRRRRRPRRRPPPPLPPDEEGRRRFPSSGSAGKSSRPERTARTGTAAIRSGLRERSASRKVRVLLAAGFFAPERDDSSHDGGWVLAIRTPVVCQLSSRPLMLLHWHAHSISQIVPSPNFTSFRHRRTRRRQGGEDLLPQRQRPVQL